MIFNFIVAFIMIIMVFIIWNSWSDTKFKWKSIKTVVLAVIASIVTVVNYFNINPVFKIFTITLFFVILYKFLFNVRLKDSVGAAVFVQILNLISESLFACIMFCILDDGVKEFVNNYFGSFITNILVLVVTFILSKIKFVKKILNSINKSISNLSDTTAVFLGISIIYLYSIFTFNIYYGKNSQLLMVLSLVISIAFSILVFMFFKAKSDLCDINDKYNNSLENLKELENALTNNRIDNHENKNQLMTIRNMTTSKKVIKFIDTILNNKLKDDKNVMHEVNIIPNGGLRGLIYSKLLIMKDKNIDYELDIASSIRIIDVLDYGNQTMLDICKIVGIFLDNSIEEVDKLDDKYIIIEMYTENDIFNILITNIFDSSVKKDNIYNAGVSTKGGNHGYGLTLVKKIIKNNKKLKNYYEINDNEFTQVLQIFK